ncbi:MAG: gliding motility-associated C-terminal domain-containing protein [Chitinophagales bacterium]
MNSKKTFKKYTFVLLLLASWMLNTVQAQPNPPKIDCASFSNSITSVVWDYMPNNDCNGTGSFEAYVIYSSTTPAGPFEEIAAIASPPPFEYNTNTTAHYYYMTIRCGGQESLPSDTVINRRPAPPKIIGTTVLPDGSVQIAFLPSPNPEVSGYLLIRTQNNGQNFETVSDVPSALEDLTIINDTIYIIDTGIDASIASIGYRLRSYSCSESENPSVLSDTHYTVFVSAEVDQCNDLVNLSWTPYIGWNQTINGIAVDSVTSYTIYTDTDTIVVAAPSTTFAYSITPNTASKCFKIVANNTTNLASESNEVCITREASNPPTDICLNILTIDTLNNVVELAWNLDETADISSLQIFRGSSLTNLQSLGEIQAGDSFISFFDPININQGPYFYQIVHVDECNRRVESNIGNTIFLSGRNQLDGTNLLNWSEFNIGENSTVNGYTIYRSENTPFKNFTPIQSENNTTLDFKDELNNVENADLSYCYYIEAQYNVICNDGTVSNELTQSNQVCISQSPRIFVPNAFAPNGVNKVFKPILRNPNPNDYQMVVFNRWGEHLFTTSDPDEGWNGYYQGKLAPQGVYAYYIRMQTELGFVLERKGTVMLVR